MDDELTISRQTSSAASIPVQQAGCPTAAAITRLVNSCDLFGPAKTVLIEHRGEQYRLIATKNGKLILQK